MLHAFRALRQVHELRLLLQTAAKLPLLPPERQCLDALTAELEPVGGWTRESLTAFEQGTLPDEVATLLRSLAPTARRALKLVP
ncbi:MAG: hypothetical protein EOO73_04805 [Myxococcales bacterium]|nr:MAG: hypothetical protein EOO73_04805 [Myxococcales bacterium]